MRRSPSHPPLLSLPLSSRRIEMYGNILIIGLVASVTARVGYYAVYGKPGGADPLPRL